MSAILLGAVGGLPGQPNTSLPNGGSTSPNPASYSLLNDGTYSITGAGTGNWLTPALAALASLWEVKVDPTSGSFASGTTGSWLSLGTTRTWTINSVTSVTFTISWRLAGSTTTLFTQTGVMLVEV